MRFHRNDLPLHVGIIQTPLPLSNLSADGAHFPTPIAPSDYKLHEMTIKFITSPPPKIHLEEVMKKSNISINKLSFRAEMQRTKLKKYCKNEVQRLDIAVLSRLCYALECDLHDLIEYIPPDKLHNQ